MIKFKKITISDKSAIQSYLEKFNPQVSELSFTNLFAWRNKYNFEFAIIDDFLWILNRTQEDKLYFSPPIGDYEKEYSKSIATLKKYLDSKNRPFIIKKADEEVKNKIIDVNGFSYKVCSNRDTFDYLYSFDALLHLNGKKYHKKKNRVNKFIRKYDNWTYERLDSFNKEACLALEEKWCTQRQCQKTPGLLYEKKAIQETIEQFEQLNCQGGLIRINGAVEAFIISERLNDDTLVIHFEKGNTDFQCIYNIIFNQHLNNLKEMYQFINREQDLGIQGIRKSKMSYHPEKLIEKYKIIIES